MKITPEQKAKIADELKKYAAHLESTNGEWSGSASDYSIWRNSQVKREYNAQKLDCERYPALKLETISDIVKVTRVTLRGLNPNKLFGDGSNKFPPNEISVSFLKQFSENEQELALNLLISCLNSIAMELGIIEPAL